MYIQRPRNTYVCIHNQCAPVHTHSPNVAQQHALKLLEFDADENGLISLEEFRAGYRALQTHTSISDRLTHVGKETLLEEFKFIDEDGDGQLTNEELEGVLLLSGVDPNATSLLVEEFFQLTDSNRDGVIDFQEFVKRFDSMDSFGIIYGQS